MFSLFSLCFYNKLLICYQLFSLWSSYWWPNHRDPPFNLLFCFSMGLFFILCYPKLSSIEKFFLGDNYCIIDVDKFIHYPVYISMCQIFWVFSVMISMSETRHRAVMYRDPYVEILWCFLFHFGFYYINLLLLKSIIFVYFSMSYPIQELFLSSSQRLSPSLQDGWRVFLTTISRWTLFYWHVFLA